ncbi:leucyl aminopeptidase [Legionella nagasakiensis]|uniref:leucyl aminopeptidase n=1 Tax=Legionella nagasakiensis TaxID=535290 RepID=UPI0010561E8C|nr:leucyl aminopeptidase [Legionella nagasakiensis]
MNYQLTKRFSFETCECLVIGIFGDSSLPDFTNHFDKTYQDILQRLASRLMENGDTAWQTDMNGHSLLLIHCGHKEQFSTDILDKRIRDIISILINQPFSQATIYMPPLKKQSPDWQMQQMLLKTDAQCYQLLDFKSKNKKPRRLETLSFFLPEASENAIHEARAIAEGIRLSRTLANYPANICTPTYLGEQAIELAKQYETLHTKIIEKNEMHQLGMGALLAVAQGSKEPPKLIEMHYLGAGDTSPVVLIGKGITFDSGGLTLKPGEAMTEMKYDMAGAASVFGTLKACALLNLPINVIGLVASAENMPSGTAVKPGDIITSLSQQTIEIINTDAEGRLVLADALTYAERFKPDLVIDIATLTGAMLIALGNVYTGFMTKDDKLAQLIETAADNSRDKAWRLPLDDDYQEAIDSPIADMVNASFDRTAGSITAACFLSRFAEKYRWAHLDIAGTAWISGKKRNATGRPVPLLVELLRHVANSH